jgi:hypothetical protein
MEAMLASNPSQPAKKLMIHPEEHCAEEAAANDCCNPAQGRFAASHEQYAQQDRHIERVLKTGKWN